MTENHVIQTVLRRAWTHRAFGAIPIAPAWCGLGAALALLSAVVVALSFLGSRESPGVVDLRIWQDRGARLAVLVALLTVYAPVARRYAALWTRQHLEDLAASRHWQQAGRSELAEAASFVEGIHPKAGAYGLALGLIAVLLIDRDPFLWTHREYWDVAHLWIWGAGLFAGWHVGCFLYAVVATSRRFSALARFIEVDLFSLGDLSPFVRQGVRSALLCVAFVSVFAVNLGDRSLWWLLAVFGPLALGITTAVAAIPVQGVHGRIRETRRRELDRVRRALQGEPHALEGSAIGGLDPASVADVLTYRAFLESVHEWPFSYPTVLRAALFVAIPVGSWLGGALMERTLEWVLP